MDTSSLVLVCVLLTCSVWMVQGTNMEVSSDDQEPVEVELSMEAGKRPSICSACKWAMKQVKKDLEQDESDEEIRSKLRSVCKKGGLLKKVCKVFVKSHLEELVEELKSDDDATTICVNVKACKKKSPMDDLF